MPEPTAIHARTLFDGRGGPPLRDHVVIMEGGRISAVRPAARGDTRAREVEILAPGFIDLQINGAADAQFNFAPTVETIARIAAGARRGGTALCLPTFITAPDRTYETAIEVGREAISRGIPGVLGLHLEGPFLSVERPGVHPPSSIRTIEPQDIDILSRTFPGPLLLTLAPEAQPGGIVHALTQAGRIVFAGHSAATASQLLAAEHEGLRGATHLFNAMSQMTVREPGVVGGILASKGLFAGIIADGHHVAWENVRIAAHLMPDRLCLVTDAMLTLSGRKTTFEIGDKTIRLAKGRLTDNTGRLAGAHVAMDESVRNMIRHAGTDPAVAVKMATSNPAHALGLGSKLGRIAVGYHANLTALSGEWGASEVWVCGVSQMRA